MSMKKNAAIITPYGLFNYGNRLQNYAVDSLLRARGFSPETLILRKSPAKANLKDYARLIAHTLGLGGTRSQKYRAFREFDRPLKKRRTWGDRHLRRTAQKYQIVAIGSDQIWNPHQVALGGLEYATFAPGALKVAVSPSFGVDAMSNEQLARVAPWLRDIDFLSVREHAGQQIIRQATGVTAPVLVDPTLAIEADRWRQVADTALNPSRPYVFVYLLGKHQEGLRAAIDAYAADRGFEVVVLMDKAEPKYHGAGPQHFISLIEGAQAVIADSFHAAVFSHLFETAFFLADRTDGVSMNSRFATFCETFELQRKPCSDVPGTSTLAPTGRSFSALLAEQRLRFIEYLDEACHCLDEAG